MQYYDKMEKRNITAMNYGAVHIEYIHISLNPLDISCSSLIELNISSNMPSEFQLAPNKSIIMMLNIEEIVKQARFFIHSSLCWK